jgi:hypothetical protein
VSVLCFFSHHCRLVAEIGSGDLSDHAKKLFVDAIRCLFRNRWRLKIGEVRYSNQRFLGTRIPVAKNYGGGDAERCLGRAPPASRRNGSFLDTTSGFGGSPDMADYPPRLVYDAKWTRSGRGQMSAVTAREFRADPHGRALRTPTHDANAVPRCAASEPQPAQRAYSRITAGAFRAII